MSGVSDVSGSVHLCLGLGNIENKVSKRDTTDTFDTEGTRIQIWVNGSSSLVCSLCGREKVVELLNEGLKDLYSFFDIQEFYGYF